MARPQRTIIENGQEAWDAGVNDNNAIIFDAPFPPVEVVDFATLAASFPANMHDGCIAVVATPSYQFYYSNGVSWVAFPSNDPDAIHDNLPGEINAVASKAMPVSADVLLIEDSADSFNKKKVDIGALSVPTDYAYGERLTSLTMTGASFTEYLKLTTPSLPAGDYRVSYSFVWIFSDENKHCNVRVQVDDTTNMINPSGANPWFKGTPKKKDIGRYVVSGFRVVPLAAGVHTVDIDGRPDAEDTSKTLTLYSAHLEVMRVG